MTRRSFLLANAAAIAAAQSKFELEELTIADLQKGMQSGRWTAQGIAQLYLSRIRALDAKTHAVIELNPDALAIAAALDKERKQGKLRGPLHGIPILLKDNIDTADKMRTSAGSLALANWTPPHDAPLVKRLRDAGAVILGKTNLSEWANFRSMHSSSGWSGRGGQTRNPYALDRSPCGSSSGSGVAVAANYCAAAIGTETDGSIVCPSNVNGIVGIKPTIGMVSRQGIIPISHTQDTAGPMARTVADAVAVLDAIAERGGGLSQSLDSNGLRGARIGIVRKAVGFQIGMDTLIERAIAAMRNKGAVIIDPVELPHMGDYDKAETDVMLYEFKAGLNAYLAPAKKSLKDLIAFNVQAREKEMPYFAQELFEQAEAKGPLTSEEYRKALAECQKLARAEGIDVAISKHKLDALVGITDSPAWPIDLINGDHYTGGFSTPAAVAGYPHITVPLGFIQGLPVGISFVGAAWSEGTLIKIAYAFEQTTKSRRPPRLS